MTTNGTETKYLEKFIIEAGKVSFTTADGRQWRMRQPSPEEAADGDSAYRLAYRRVMDDKRMADLAGSKEGLEREAQMRGTGAEAVYLLPLLLEKPGNITGEWQPAYNPFDPASLAEFEALGGAVVAEMTKVYLGSIQGAMREAKKKSPALSS